MLRFGSLEFMSLDGSYDMILLPPLRDNDNGGRQPACRRQNRRRLPHVAEEQHPALRNKARCISYMRQEDNIYNNRVYRDNVTIIRVFIT
jgi:hypothetical protein